MVWKKRSKGLRGEVGSSFEVVGKAWDLERIWEVLGGSWAVLERLGGVLERLGGALGQIF